MDNDNWTPVAEPQRPGVVVHLVSYPSLWAGVVGDEIAGVLSEAAEGWLAVEHEGFGCDLYDLADEISREAARLKMPFCGAGRPDDDEAPDARALRIAAMALAFARSWRDAAGDRAATNNDECQGDPEDAYWEPGDGVYALDGAGDGLERRVYGAAGYTSRVQSEADCWKRWQSWQDDLAAREAGHAGA